MHVQIYTCISTNTSGAYAGFLRGGFWIYMKRSCEPLIGGFGGMPPPPQEFFF